MIDNAFLNFMAKNMRIFLYSLY